MFRRTVSLAFMAGVGLFLAACGDSPTGPAGAAYDQGPSLIVEPPAEDCHECKGGVNTLALVNNGPAGTVVVKDNDGNELYHAVVSTGIPFVFVGKGEGQAMGPQITITVDGGAPVIIDTSCSTAIGVGSVFGAFTVLTGSSTEGGALGAPGETCTEPPVECAECKGGVTELTLRNDGAGGTIVVKDKDGNQLFNGFVATGSEFSFVGVGKDGKLGTEIRISVDGGPVLSIHTSCSQPIGVGSVFGAFTVVAGASKDGGALGAPGQTCPPPDDCTACKGGVTALTLRNDGAAGTIVVKDKDGHELFNAFVAAGADFSFVGVGDANKMGTEITITVDGGPALSIHVSCSQPIGVGSVFGAFTVVAGASKDGGALGEPTAVKCKSVKKPKSQKDCSNCKGGVTALTLRNDGAAGTIVVKDKDGRQLFNGFVAAGAQFSFVGVDKDQKMGTEITISVDDGAVLSIHTSCSQPIGVGSVFGAFTVMAGASKDGGALEALTELSCDVKPPKSMKDCSNCKGGVTALTLRNDGAAGTVVVKDKDGRQLFNGFVAAGAQFSFVGLGDANKLGTEITISVDGGAALSIHTSCSQPIGVGSVFGAFTVMAGASKDGGALGPLAAACAPADAGGGTVTLGIAPTSGEALSSRWRVVVWRRT